jgi:hypothetical protein
MTSTTSTVVQHTKVAVPIWVLQRVTRRDRFPVCRAAHAETQLAASMGTKGCWCPRQQWQARDHVSVLQTKAAGQVQPLPAQGGLIGRIARSNDGNHVCNVQGARWVA